MRQNVCKWYYVCPMKKFYEEGRLDRHWINNYCKGEWQKCIRYKYVENNIAHPNTMLPNGEINERL